MNIDEIKSAWAEYDRKLQSTQALNEKIITGMITQRSNDRFRQVRREYIFGFIWMLFWLSMGIIITATNPFGYRYPIQYTSIIVFCACLLILMVGMIIAYRQLSDITISLSNIDESLKKIIAIYEKPNRFFKYTVVVLIISQVVLFPLSFLPPNIENMGLMSALAERLIPISVSALLIFIAHKLGAFKDQHKDKFKADLNELKEYKAMSAELLEDQTVS